MPASTYNVEALSPMPSGQERDPKVDEVHEGCHVMKKGEETMYIPKVNDVGDWVRKVL